MKKFFISFALFAVFTAMILMISCGGNSSSGGSSVSNFGKLGGECYPNETCDEGFLCDTENNICVEDPENPVQDSDTSSEQTNDNVDTQSEQNDDKTDTLPENDNDSADDGDTIDPDITDSGETDGETRVQDCTGLPENAEWNTVSSITQRWDGEKWVPSAVASFNFEGSENECRFKCVSGYTWDGSQCVQPSDPCNPNPCTNMPNSKGTCIIDSTSYVCGCNPGYEWNGTSCVVMTREINCTEKPENAVWNTVSSITQTYNGSEWTPSNESEYNTSGSTQYCRFKCAPGYGWNGSSCYECAEWDGSTCVLFPECSSTSSTPCTDSSTGYIWSAKASSEKTWNDAKSYCNNLTKGGYSDWHLPTIDELKTLLINADRVTNRCEVSNTNGCLSRKDCWMCSTCTQTGTQNSSDIYCSSYGTSYSDGRYSKLGDSIRLWSSSTLSDIDITGYAWGVNFSYGLVGNYDKTSSSDVRCVR
ncbi:DUF1566 domain-containing protein [bacterium]|nr:DUF1566 domain-containing protein [bacterium]